MNATQASAHACVVPNTGTTLSSLLRLSVQLLVGLSLAAHVSLHSTAVHACVVRRIYTALIYYPAVP